MIDLKNLATLEIETTNTCNAVCPLCLRGEGMNTYDRLDWHKIINNIPDYVWSGVKEVCFNGTTGDNIMHPQIHDIIRWVRDHSPARIVLNTNGALRGPAWWRDLGTMLKDHPHVVVFGIDGLEDTHSIYRVNTRWDRVIENAQAFIEAGGCAEWQMILFAHNAHQVGECRQLSEKMGFSRFFTLYQDRFDQSGEVRNIQGTVIKRLDLKQGQPDETRETSNDLKKRLKQFTGKITCRSQATNWLCIYADGTVWPCCWLMGWHRAKHQAQHVLINYHFKKVLGIDLESINLYNNRLEDIVAGDLWQNRYPNSFATNPNPVCIQQCSK